MNDLWLARVAYSDSSDVGLVVIVAESLAVASGILDEYLESRSITGYEAHTVRPALFAYHKVSEVQGVVMYRRFATQNDESGDQEAEALQKELDADEEFGTGGPRDE